MSNIRRCHEDERAASLANAIAREGAAIAVATVGLAGIAVSPQGNASARDTGYVHRFRAGVAITAVRIVLALAASMISILPPSPAAAQLVTFSLNDVRFYIPAQWTVTVIGSVPDYAPLSTPPFDTVHMVERSIMLQFPHIATHPDWRTRYREIEPPFSYELVLQPGIKNLEETRNRPRAASDPITTTSLAGKAPDQDGFIRLGPKFFVAVRTEDNDGAGGYLQFYCRTGLTERDRGISSSCTTYVCPLDGIGLRMSFDGIDFDKPRWRDIVLRSMSFVRWLATHPNQRSATFR
jgi:hypothetical protein